MNRTQKSKELRERILIALIGVIVVLITGAVMFMFIEGWSFIDAFYFVTMTATTVGYGDLIPTHTTSKIITILYSLSIVPLVLYAFTIVAKAQMDRVYHKLHHIERKQKSTEKELEATENKILKTEALVEMQEGALSDQQKKIRSQIRKMREQAKELENHDKEIEAQKRKIREQAKINKEQEKEISEHDKELEVVEEVMEEAIKK
jgi:DNA repair exonuclease SbcCD ATPase subunit